MMEKIRQGKDGKVRVGIANWATTVKKSNDGKGSTAMIEKRQGGHCPLGNNGQERQSWQQGNGGKGSKAMMEGSLV